VRILPFQSFELNCKKMRNADIVHKEQVGGPMERYLGQTLEKSPNFSDGCFELGIWLFRLQLLAFLSSQLTVRS